jgi:hypothetical protein
VAVRQHSWQILAGLPAWQVTEIPRSPQRHGSEPAERRDLGGTQRFQALAAAYCRGAPVVFGWVREHPQGPVRVLAVGPGMAGSTDGHQAVLTLPSGARGRLLPAGRRTRSSPRCRAGRRWQE